MIDWLLASIGKLFLGLALIFIIGKYLYKRKGSPSESYFATHKMLLYQLHVNGAKVTLVFGLIHGIMNMDASLISVISGWFLILTLVGLTACGALLSIKHQAKPMTLEDDQKWLTIRHLKWTLTVLTILLITFHTLYYQLM